MRSKVKGKQNQGERTSHVTKHSRKGLDTKKYGSLFEEKLKAVAVKSYTGFEGIRWEKIVPEARPWRYIVTGITVSGAAPKNFIRVYDHSAPVRERENPQLWPAYIAKVGHKRYPSESYTEQLMTAIGTELGLRMADSRLMLCDNQVRFLSRYFLRPDESLDHASDILGGYLADREFVTTVGEAKLEQQAFTFKDFCKAIHTTFPAQADSIILDLVRMIAFDAVVGNQDRHLQNWGVIVQVSGARVPRFSPIFDTARGLFWNESEDQLSAFDSDDAVLGYVRRARPLIGWEGDAAMNHFALVKRIATDDTRHGVILKQFCSVANLRRINAVVDTDFHRLLSAARRALIKRCLTLRMRMFAEAVGVTL